MGSSHETGNRGGKHILDYIQNMLGSWDGTTQLMEGHLESLYS
jgi:hypothetical protein